MYALITIAFYNDICFVRWFCGNLTRKEAERLLLQDCHDRGTFLVRVSETNEGKYCIKCFGALIWIYILSVCVVSRGMLYQN